MAQKSKRIKIFYSLIALIILFFGINFHWTSAALAWVYSHEPCPTALIEKSKARLVPLFHGVKARPIIHCQSKKVKGAPGMVNFAPFLPEIVTLRYHGRNKDVIAHEYAHAELSTRLGFLPRLLHIPTWFDEGLAMQVDHRPDYSQPALKRYLLEKSIKNNGLSHLATVRNFFHRGSQGKYHYALSRCVVQKWLQAHDKQALGHLIQNLSWFGAFPTSSFAPYEKSCMTTAL